jgi:hypothetical protein
MWVTSPGILGWDGVGRCSGCSERPDESFFFAAAAHFALNSLMTAAIADVLLSPLTLQFGFAFILPTKASS